MQGRPPRRGNGHAPAPANPAHRQFHLPPWASWLLNLLIDLIALAVFNPITNGVVAVGTILALARMFFLRQGLSNFDRLFFYLAFLFVIDMAIQRIHSVPRWVRLIGAAVVIYVIFAGLGSTAAEIRHHMTNFCTTVGVGPFTTQVCPFR